MLLPRRSRRPDPAGLGEERQEGESTFPATPKPCKPERPRGCSKAGRQAGKQRNRSSQLASSAGFSAYLPAGAGCACFAPGGPDASARLQVAQARRRGPVASLWQGPGEPLGSLASLSGLEEWEEEESRPAQRPEPAQPPPPPPPASGGATGCVCACVLPNMSWRSARFESARALE